MPNVDAEGACGVLVGSKRPQVLAECSGKENVTANANAYSTPLSSRRLALFSNEIPRITGGIDRVGGLAGGGILRVIPELLRSRLTACWSCRFLTADSLRVSAAAREARAIGGPAEFSLARPDPD